MPRHVHPARAFTLAAAMLGLVAGCDDLEPADAEPEFRSHDEEIMQEVPGLDEPCAASIGSMCQWNCFTFEHGVMMGFPSYWHYNPILIDGKCVDQMPTCALHLDLVPRPSGKNIVIHDYCDPDSGKEDLYLKPL